MIRIAPILLIVLVVAAPAAGQRRIRKAYPVERVWQELMPADEEERAARQELTQLEGYLLIKKKVMAVRRQYKSKKYKLNLKVIGVIPPAKFSGPENVMVQGLYVDDLHKKTFGEGATIVVWTKDHDTSETLSKGDYIEISGKVFVQVHYPASDIEKYRVPSEWKQKNINTAVAFLSSHRTGFPIAMRCYMVNAAIRKLDIEPGQEPQ